MNIPWLKLSRIEILTCFSSENVGPDTVTRSISIKMEPKMSSKRQKTTQDMDIRI